MQLYVTTLSLASYETFMNLEICLFLLYQFDL